MKKTLLITIAAIALLALYKIQHIRPVDDPKDSPIFQQRLKSSLERFQEDEFPARMARMQEQAMQSPMASASMRPPALTKDLTISGRCESAYLTWVEGGKIAKENISVERRARNKEYALLKDKMVFEREETEGTRYWIVDRGLTDGVNYEYLLSFKDASGKEIVKGPISIDLTCTEKDKEILAQRDKMAKEYYQKKGAPLPPSPPSTQGTRTLVAIGRCGRITLTWFEEMAINKESLTIKRKTPQEAYSLIKPGLVYERPEGDGVRYWVSDSGLTDGVNYEYLISYKDSHGNEKVKQPVEFTPTCNEKDREIIAQQEKAIKEYYQKRGIVYTPGQPLTYQLGKETYTIALGNSPQKGRNEAPVILVIFTDFECTHCSTWARTLDTIQKTFSNEVKIVFKNFPIPYHTRSESAAIAALAAGEQGKFWEMHDLLFKSQNALKDEDINGYAKLLGLDISKFKKSIESKELKKIIEQDKAQAKSLGVQNAPTTFINGRILIGSPPASTIKAMIENILKNKK